MKAAVFVWENFGPGHIDRLNSTYEKLQDRYKIVGIEQFGRSATYDWDQSKTSTFQRQTLFERATVTEVSWLRRYVATLRECWKHRGGFYFLCNYEEAATLWLAVTLRLLGQRVHIMNVSKFDDYERTLWREVVKWCYYLPYQGAISSGIRPIDYLRFLGLPKNKIVPGYNTLNLARVRNQRPLAKPEISFHKRHFLIVARLVEKKNLFNALSAYSTYAIKTENPRPLVVAGSGPLDKPLRQHADALGISSLVSFVGFVQTDAVSALMAESICLILVSTEEQFGNAVIEAVALNIPSIVSTNVGARDHLVESSVTGFVVEPNNIEGIAYFMETIGGSEPLWQTMRSNIGKVSDMADSSHFAAGILQLIDPAASSFEHS